VTLVSSESGFVRAATIDPRGASRPGILLRSPRAHPSGAAESSRVAACRRPRTFRESFMATAIAPRLAPVEFMVHVDDFRSHRIPGLSNSKVGSCFIRGDELVKHLDLDKWLVVNPRVPTRSAKDVLTGHVVRGIQDTLREAPSDFALKNQGLYLLVASVGEYERQRDGGRLRFTM